jgi:hypothetical protein
MLDQSRHESLWNADRLWDSFPEFCHQAKDVCALYRDGDDVKNIAARIDGVMTSIQKQLISRIDPVVKMLLSIS